MRQDQPFNQQVLLENISTLLKGFKKLLKTVQEIIAQMVAEQDYNSHLKQLLSNAAQLEQNAQEIDYILPSDNDVQSIFLRLINRLSEHIVNVSKPNVSYTASNYIEKLLSKIQECLKAVTTSRNVGALFLSIFSIFKQFIVVAERLYYAQPLPEDGIFVQKDIIYTQTNLSVKQQNPLPQPQIPQNQSQFHKVMNVLNGYYSSLNCLDLDYSSFKTFYFQTRTQNQQNLVQSMTEKNGIVNKALTKYNKRFHEFKRKKQKIEQRRTKLVSLQDLQPLQQASFALNQRHTIMSIYNKRQKHQNQLEDQIVVGRAQSKYKRENPQKEESIDYQSNCKKKTSYQIKNVYLTFKKPLRQEKNSYSNSPRIFQTALQPIDLSKTIQESDIGRRHLKFNQKHIKLSPVKLIGFVQTNLRDCLIQQLQSHKIARLGIGNPATIIHHNNMRRPKEMQSRPVRASSFARKISKEFKFCGPDRIFKTIQKQNPYKINDELIL